MNLNNDSLTFKVNIISDKHLADLKARKKRTFAGSLDKFRNALPSVHKKSYMIGIPTGHSLDPLAFKDRCAGLSCLIGAVIAKSRAGDMNYIDSANTLQKMANDNRISKSSYLKACKEASTLFDNYSKMFSEILPESGSDIQTIISKLMEYFNCNCVVHKIESTGDSLLLQYPEVENQNWVSQNV